MKLNAAQCLWGAVALSGFLSCVPPSRAQGGFPRNGPPDKYQDALTRLSAMTAVPVRDWRTHAADMPHPEDPSLNDSGWEAVTLGGFGGRRGAGGGGANANGPRWYRTTIALPAMAGGRTVEGSRVRLAVRMSSDGRVFFNGVVVAQGEGRLLDPILITNHVVPGEKVQVSVNVPLHSANGRFLGATLLIDTPAQVGPGEIRNDIQSAEAILSGFPDGDAAREAQLDAAVKALDFAALDKGDQGGFTHSLETASADMQPLRDWMKQFSVNAVGNSHIDMAWLWPWTETVEVVRDTFSTALQLMREYPNFTYVQSSAQDFKWLEDKYPDIFLQIQDRVKEGRWELVGGMWVEPDLNMPDGESLVRQLLEGKKYFKQKFGVDIRIGWNPDSFGYSAQLPQIYKKSGVDYFVTQKLDWNETNKPPHKLFWWEAPDGSKILTYLPNGYANQMNPVGIARDVANYTPNTGQPELLYLYGVGDHGGGPTRAMLDQALDLQKPSAVFPPLQFGKVQGFFDDVENRMKAGLNIPTVKDELYLEFHRGVYTSQSETKKAIREDEELLQNSEKFASLAYLDGVPYPHEEFQENWRHLLFDHFHDIMPGSGIAINYKDAAENLHNVSLQGQKILHDSMGEITGHINTEGRGTPVVIYNPLSWARTETVEIEAPFPPTVRSVDVRDASGKKLLAQVEGMDSATHRAKVSVLVKDVPPLGYEVIHIQPGKGGRAAASTLKASGTTLENEFVRVVVDPKTGCITSLFNKADGKEALASGACGNLLQAFHDQPREYDAWNIDADFEKQSWDLNEAQDVKLIESGPVRAVIRVTKKFSASSFVQDICLYAGVPRVDVKMQTDWHEKHILLKVAFPVSVQSDFATYEIPYGTIQRPTTRNTSIEKAKFEVPALRWGDLSDSTHGFSLLNASKYGYDAKGNTIRLSLLRSPSSPDPHADEGFHEFTYALYPHSGDWRAGGSMQQAYDLNFPMIPVEADAHPGEMPPASSFASVQPGNVLLTVVKKAEEEDALVFRYYEFEGKQTDARLRLPRKAIRAVETDLMEKDGKPLPLSADGRVVTLSTGPYEIKTVKVWFSASQKSPQMTPASPP